MSREVVTNDHWSKYAQAYVAQEDTYQGRMISTRGGVLTVGMGEDAIEMPGNRMAVIVLDAVRENTFYGTRYDPEYSAPPICYAFGHTAEDMAPHEDMGKHEHFDPQHDTCAGCPMAEWGSAERGNGKACQNRRRLALLPAGIFEKVKGKRGEYSLELFDDEEHFAEADISYLKLPVTSVRLWADYLESVARSTGRPPFGVITEIYLEPDPKTQYKVKFELIDVVPDALAETLMQRHEEARDEIIQPYGPPREDAKPAGRSGLRGLKRKTRREED